MKGDIDLEHFIIELVEFFKQLSYLGIMLALTIEFVPAEIVLPLAGYWVSTGEMNLWLVVLAGTIGGTLGPITLYALGRYGGRPFLVRFGKYLFIKEKQLAKADQFFEKYGASVAFIARFLPGVRTLISIPCGLAKMKLWVFSVYTFLAMLPITFLYVFLGYKLGPRWKEVGALANEYLLPIGIFLLLIIITIFYIKKKKETKKVEHISFKSFVEKKNK
jgi:membrane protein DedA with SNARE-associated domain